MKNLILGLAVILSLTSKSMAADYVANHCEIFVDKVISTFGSHAARNITFYVKTLNERLDGQIVEVGLSGVQTNESNINGKNSMNIHYTLSSFFNSANYWTTSFNVSSDFGNSTDSFAFYVKTSKGIVYWAQPRTGNTFIIDPQAWSNIASLMSVNAHNVYSPDVSQAVPTQQGRFDGYYNPDNCY